MAALHVSAVEPARSHTHAASCDGVSRSVQTRRASDALEGLLSQYASKRRAIDVSFRELVGPMPVNFLSHSIYPYPARLLRQIPRFFLHCEQLVRPGEAVLDPFCGSGTVLVEARAAHLTGWGIDRNPFARLLSQVKTTPVDLGRALEAVAQTLARAKAFRSGRIPDVVNVDLWFSACVKRALGRIRRAIDESQVSREIRHFLLVSLALVAERSSLRDPRIPVPVRRRDWRAVRRKQQAFEVFETFDAVATSVAARLAAIPSPLGVVSLVEGEDAAEAAQVYRSRLADRLQRPKLILTSPPYGAAQKYIRSSSLALGWTGLATAPELTELERGLIGREHIRLNEMTVLGVPTRNMARKVSFLASRDAMRGAIYAHYFRAMYAVIRDLASVLSPGGALVLVAGSNTVSDSVVHTHRYLKGLAIRHGLRPILELRDTIRGRVLLTKRARPSTLQFHEAIHVFRKVSP